MRANSTAIFLFLALFCLRTVNAEWVKQNTNSLASFRDVTFVSASKGFIVGDDGLIMSTVNGGTTWEKMTKFMTDGISQIHFTSETTGWLLCQRNIYSRGSNASSYVRKTTDGGKNWEKIEFQDGGRERVTRLLFNKDGSATAFGEGGIFYKLQEDGVSWKKIQTSIHFLLLDGSFGENMTGAIVGAGGTIMFTEDSGFTWEKASLLGDTDVKLNAVCFPGSKGGVAVGTGGRVFRSNGGARQWRQQQPATASNLNDVFFTSATAGWAVGDDGTMLRTTDGGVTWYPVNSRTTHNLAKVTFVGSKGWAIGFGGTLLTYEDGAAPIAPGEKPTLFKRNET